MKFFGIKEAWGAQGSCKFLWSNDLWGALARKNKIVIFSQVFSRARFCFFLHKPLQCPNTTKIGTQLLDHSLFDAKKFHIFLNFLAIFLNLLFTGLHIYCFSFVTSSWNAPTAREIARTLRTWVSLISQIFRFFRFFLLFFWGRSMPFDRLWPDGNGAKGHFCKGT